jgi:gallate dioxygenase
MARIIGGVATSHTPTIGFAYDQDKQDDPDWGPIFKAFEPVSAWFREKQPDAIVYIFNDHVTSFFFDHGLHARHRRGVPGRGRGRRRAGAAPGAR